MGRLLRFISLFIVLLALTMGIVSGLSAPAAEFKVNKTFGPAPFGVLFIDLSTGEQITSWAWDFENDGIIDSTEEFPWHVYPDPGNYTVSLTVTNAAGSDTETKPAYIIVLDAIAYPVPDFSATPTSGPQPMAVQFTDRSTGGPITSWAWDFENDGIVDSTQQNPLFMYTTPGKYTVKLTVTGAGGTGTMVYSYISVLPAVAPPVAQFTGVPMSGTSPLTVIFTDQSTGDLITSRAWDFENDGIVDSMDQNPTFTYTSPGTYTVKLTVTNTAGSDSEVKSGYIIVTPPAPPVAQFTGVPTYGKRPLTVRFTDQSTGAGITVWAWDFQNDGMIDSTDQNPSFTYTKAGTYSVKLTVTNPGGSSSKTKWSYITVKR
jgi:PKD repeat protein